MDNCNRRTFFVHLGSAALTVGTATQPTRAFAAAASEGITIWSDISDAASQAYFLEKLIKPFEAANGDAKVAVVFRDSRDLDRQIRLALQAGSAPDVVTTNGPAFVPELAAAGLLADMTAYGQIHSWQDKLLPWAFELGEIDGRLYSIPTQFETLGIFYNTKVFADRGIRIPKTRSDFERLSDDLLKSGIKPFAAGNADFRQTVEWYVSVFLNHYAGPEVMYQALTGQRPWTDPIFVEAIELMCSYFERGYFGGSVEQYFATGNDAVHTDLAEGRAAMCVEGTWLFETINDFFKSEADWDFAPFPSLREQVRYPLYTIGCGGTLSINKVSQTPDLAAKYIDFLIGDLTAAGERIADQSSIFSLPLRFGERDLPTRMNAKYRGALLSLIEATSTGNFGYTNWTFQPPKTANFLYTAIEKVLAGSLPPIDYCKGVQRTFERELSAGYTPRVMAPAGATR